MKGECLVVRTVTRALWLQDTLFHSSSEHEQTDFDPTDLPT